ncbi:hypothetical protein GOP47_0013874 [Adiantum capillus-veneris]|uniref:Uncharacterized protein n=1 Tax=Adiantum capillus-veneris TaxID=13818 RepID=A0A9D4UPC4_ADICA|nr:hypothetical protein GOP47_0013874 [Adiantum capillus-veneris]
MESPKSSSKNEAENDSVSEAKAANDAVELIHQLLHLPRKYLLTMSLRSAFDERLFLPGRADQTDYFVIMTRLETE